MRAITIAEPKRLEKIDIAEPTPPAPGEAIVRTHCMGVCGTDISSYLGKFPFFDYPRIPGHELGVEVLEVGSEVENVRPGDKCSVEPYLNCGNCYACRNRKTNCCESLKVIGVMCDGGLCDRFKIRADKLHVSKSLDYEQLALVETLAIGFHGTERATPKEGDQVLIIGAGPIGMSMLEFTRLSGAKISVMDMSEERLDFCKNTYPIEQAIHFTGDGSELDKILDITGGVKYAIVADATGNHHSMANAMNYVSHGGTLLLLGVTTEDLAIPHPKMHRSEMTLMSSRNALGENFSKIIQLIENGEIDTKPWITHRTNFEDSIGAFETFAKPDSGVIKAVIEVSR